MRGGQDNWLDQFSLAKSRDAAPGPLEFFSNPFGSGTKPQADGCLQLLPGVDALDLFSNSIRAEIWKDGVIIPCFVPQSLVGWEFLSLLWPQPSGSSPLRLSAAVELLIGRPPGAPQCPSLLFAFVPASHLHTGANATQKQAGAAPLPVQGKGMQIQTCERLAGNLAADCRTLTARLFVLCPTTVYNDTVELPDEQNWGLFIGPRSRSLVLLNQKRGRIDLNLASLLAIDAVYRSCQNLVDATARLFESFGTASQVPTLFGQAMDPLKVHCGFTNATAVEHLCETLDGREDYWRTFGVKLPTFFLSNASSNLGFLTPLEAQQMHAGTGKTKTVSSAPLPPMPRWSLLGHLGEAGHNQIMEYRARMQPLMRPPDTGGGLLQMLGLDAGGASGDWFPMLGAACTEMSFANDTPIIAQPAGSVQSSSAYAAGASPSPAQQFGQEQGGSVSPPLPPPGVVGADPEPEPQFWVQAKSAQAKTSSFAPSGTSESRGRQPARGNNASSGATSAGGSRSVSADRGTDRARLLPTSSAGRGDAGGIATEH